MSELASNNLFSIKMLIKKLFSIKSIILICGIVIALSYILLFGRYKLEDVDDAWSTSFIYNLIEKGEERDIVFEGSGQGGVLIFGKTQAYVYAPLLSLTDYSKSAMFTISHIFILLGAVFWYKSTRLLKFNRSFSLMFVGVLLISEPVISAANSARIEAINFFFIALSLYLVIRGTKFSVLLSGLISLLAIENHPMGANALVYVSAYFFYLLLYLKLPFKEFFKKYWVYFAGILLGLIYYLLLHGENLGIFGELVNRVGSVNKRHYMMSYYFGMSNLRHIFDLGFTLISTFIFILKKLYRKNGFILLLPIFVLIVSLILTKDNYHYAIYLYPALILFICFSFWKSKLLKYAYVLFVVVQSFQYIYLAYRNRDFDWNTYSYAINAIELKEEIPIVASPNEWFIYKDREFYAMDNIDFFERLPERFYFIEENDWRIHYSKEYSARISVLEKYNKTLIDKKNIQGEEYHFFLLELR